MMFVRRFDAPSCGASLVASSWAVTAAHCVTQIELTQSGCYRRMAKEQFSLDLHFRENISLSIDPIVHEDYSACFPLHHNDIALLKLDEVVDLNTYTPVCLPPQYTDFTGLSAHPYGELKR